MTAVCKAQWASCCVPEPFAPVVAAAAAGEWLAAAAAAPLSPPPPPPPPTLAGGPCPGAHGSPASALADPGIDIGSPAPLSSRQGRAQQRYAADGARLLAGCIPVRFRPGACGASAAEVLLITSRGGKGWVFPKGGWEDDECVEAAAKRETVEEAGVRGAIAPLGVYPYQSGKHKPCVCHVFVMTVAEELSSWPEHEFRQRRWMPVAQAVEACRHQWMRGALLQWASAQGWQLPLAAAPAPAAR